MLEEVLKEIVVELKTSNKIAARVAALLEAKGSELPPPVTTDIPDEDLTDEIPGMPADGGKKKAVKKKAVKQKPAPAKGKDTAITEDSIRKQAQRLVTLRPKTGMTTALGILKKFGVDKIFNLTPGDYKKASELFAQEIKSAAQ